MIAHTTLLPKEVAALVRHIELNRSGWWDQVIQGLTLSAVWLSAYPPNVAEIKKTFLEEFKLTLSHGNLLTAIGALEKNDFLVALPNGKYRIPDAQRLLFEQNIAEAEKDEFDAREFFYKLAKEIRTDLDADGAWRTFQAELLTPLINEVGANAYHLITGQSLRVDQDLVDKFLKKFGPEFHSDLRELVTRFLDPKKDEVRAHVSRMLHARFCVEAGGLSQDVIQGLSVTAGKQVEFRVYVDTNFLFSLLELHENPSNAAARDLLDLLSQLKSNPKVTLCIVPTTIEEAKTSITAAKNRVSGIPAGRNFTEAALRTEVSGMDAKFLSERLRCGGNLTAEDWFDPYLNDFVTLTRGKGVEFSDESQSSYAMRQDVLDDISQMMEFQKRLDGSKRRSYGKVKHDMILWHLVNDKRPAYIESPIDSRDWILTVDYRLIGFDQYKQRKSGSKIPICLHPTSLIQLLQFWVPRTKEFEEAMLGGLRLPILFQKFDVEAERTSIRILKGLGRFEGRDDLSVETITNVIFNDGLRARIQTEKTENGDEEISLIRDALIEEMKTRATAEANRATAEANKVQELKDILKQKEAILSDFDTRERSKDVEIGKLTKKVSEEESRREAEVEKTAALDTEVTQLKEKFKQIDEEKKDRASLFRYLASLAVVIIMASVAAWQSDRFSPDWVEMVDPILLKVLIAILVFVAGHLLLELKASRHDRMKKLWPYVQIRRFRGWLWGIVILGILAVVANHISGSIEK